MAGPYRYVLGPVVERTENGMAFYGAPESCVSWIDLRRLSSMSSPGQLGYGFFTMPSGWAIPSGYHWLAENQGPGDCRSLYLTAQDQSAWASLIGVTPSRTASTTLIDALDETLTTLADPTGDSAPKPIVPGVGEGPPPVADIILGGHSSVRRKELAIGGGWWKKLVALHQRELDDDAARDPTDRLWRKRLGDLSRKYFGSHDDPRGNQLVSQQLKRDRAPSNPGARVADRIYARQPETTFTESFNKADSDTLGPDLTWTEVSNDWDVVSNAAQQQTASAFVIARAEHDVSSADQYAECTVTALGSSGNSQGGPVARFSASATTFYGAIEFNLSTYYLYKVVAGAYTTLATGSASTSVPFVLRCKCDGSTISHWLAGVQKASVTDTAISTGTRGGIWVYNANVVKVSIDDWSIADLAAATTRGMPLGTRGTAFNGGRTFAGNIR